MIRHSGAFAMGAGTSFAIIPSADIGIVVLTNAWPTGVAEALIADFTDLVQFGRVERDWFAAYKPLMAPLTAAQGSLVGKPRPAQPAPAAKLSDDLGTYSNSLYGDLEIIGRGDALVLRIGPAGIEYPLTHWDGNAFTFNPSNENQPDGSISLATFRLEDRSVTIEYLTPVHALLSSELHWKRSQSILLSIVTVLLQFFL